jgi:topoisomerase-4 subunit B
MTAQVQQKYSASDIEVLEGLEPVRLRPGMYIGGTDSTAMHHMINEVLDNAMDEAVAEHADTIRVTLEPGNRITIQDNGRGIPTDPHPKYPKKSALEVIMTTLHSGGKFSGKAYATSGGLHGVGVSVVNTLSSELIVTVVRDKQEFQQSFSRGPAVSGLEKLGDTRSRNGTTVSFIPDSEIFGDQQFDANRVRKLVRSKAYLYKGVTLHWTDQTAEPATKEQFHYPQGVLDYLTDTLGEKPTLTDAPFNYQGPLFKDGKEVGKIECALAWPLYGDSSSQSYVNTVPTPQGGTHEQGLRAAIVKGMKDYAEMRNRKGPAITADDVLNGSMAVLSVFIREPQFQGQTKDKLTNSEVVRQVETALKDPFDLWLANNMESADALLNRVFERAQERLRRKQELEVKRKTATSRRLRLPGKLADCSAVGSEDTELFLVEGDSAGGSAKQARDRKTQAILPLRGKILNVASATKDKLKQNKELQDLMQALGCRTGADYKEKDLRYERIVIMTDADVDGAHIATLLMTFFITELPELVLQGRLFLALPPLYKLSHSGTTAFALDDAEKDRLLATTFKGKRNVEMSRFKGLGEMLPSQLKETTMNKDNRKLLQIDLPSLATGQNLVGQLMGKNPEERLNFIRENANMGAPLDI